MEKTKTQIIQGAKNYAYSFLPTPIDPAEYHGPSLDEFKQRSRMPWFHEIQKQGHTGRILQDYTNNDESEPASAENTSGTAEKTKSLEDEENNPFENVNYPDPVINEKALQYGAFMVYLIGKFYKNKILIL